MGVLEGYLYLAGLTLLIVRIVIGAARRFRVSAGGAPEAAGVVAMWAAFGLLAAGAAPGFGYLFVWPALAGAAFLVAGARRSPGGRWRFARLVVVGSITLVLLIPAIDTFYQLAQPRPGNPDSQIPAVVVIPALLIAITIELVTAFRLAGATPSTT